MANINKIKITRGGETAELSVVTTGDVEKKIDSVVVNHTMTLGYTTEVVGADEMPDDTNLATDEIGYAYNQSGVLDILDGEETPMTPMTPGGGLLGQSSDAEIMPMAMVSGGMHGGGGILSGGGTSDTTLRYLRTITVEGRTYRIDSGAKKEKKTKRRNTVAHICNGVMPVNAVPGNVYMNYGLLRVNRGKNSRDVYVSKALISNFTGIEERYLLDRPSMRDCMRAIMGKRISPWKLYFWGEWNRLEEVEYEDAGDSLLIHVPVGACVYLRKSEFADGFYSFVYNHSPKYVTMSEDGYVVSADDIAKNMKPRWLPAPTVADLSVDVDVVRKGRILRNRVRIEAAGIRRKKGYRLVVQARRIVSRFRGDDGRPLLGTRSAHYVKSHLLNIRKRKQGVDAMVQPFRARYQGMGAVSEWRYFVAVSDPRKNDGEIRIYENE